MTFSEMKTRPNDTQQKSIQANVLGIIKLSITTPNIFTLFKMTLGMTLYTRTAEYCNTECHILNCYAECCYPKCHHTKCPGAAAHS
jgi:hypothetical protein